MQTLTRLTNERARLMTIQSSNDLADTGQSPLAAWSVLQTNDIERAYDTISSTFKEHVFETSERSRVSDTKLHHLDFGDVSINYIQYGLDIVVDAECLEDFFLVHMPIKGESNVWFGEDQLHLSGQSAAICSPSAKSKFEWRSDCGVVAVKIEKSALHNYFEEIYGVSLRDQFVFLPEMSDQNGVFSSWRNLIQYITTEANSRHSVITKTGVGEEIKRLIFSCLINNQPHNQTDYIASQSSTAAPRHVRLAEEYMRANIGARITISDLSRCANVSERTLFNGFREFRQTTPMQYVADLRLEQVRKELRRADNADSVAQIASRWGFFHQGAFASAYRKKFGETATQTRSKARL